MTLQLTEIKPWHNDSFSSRLTFTASREYKIGWVCYGVFYLLATLSDDLGFGWFEGPGLIIAIASLLITIVPYSMTKNFGTVIFKQDGFQLEPKKSGTELISSPVKLSEMTEIQFHYVYSLRLVSAYHIIQCVLKDKQGEFSNFGFVIKNKAQEKQYLEYLDSWYRQGLNINESNGVGQKTFKIDQGKNYEEIQQIKQEYGINW